MAPPAGGPKGLHVSAGNLAVAVDLYELTMAAGYHAHGREDRATFDLYVRDMGPGRGFLVAAGLDQAVRGVLDFRFPARAIEYLKGLPAFSGVPDGFFERLRDFRYSGDVRAVEEGRVVFAGEPILSVTAPIIEAQILETYLITSVNVQTMVASKAARVVLAAGGRDVVDFGSRRAHGPEAGLLAARAAYIGGCVGTSNVLAGMELGIPVVGTAAHSWTMSWETEAEAFSRYREALPGPNVLLVDTYDTLGGTRRAAATGPGLGGVRLDSGDLAELSKEARRILDSSGQAEARVIASGDLDEGRIAELLRAGAPIDAFGVGTRMATSEDQPSLSAVYKLVEVAGRPVLKTSGGKESFPGRKQVFRASDPGGRMTGDVLGLEGEQPGGTALLSACISGGRLVREDFSARSARDRRERDVAALPEGVRRLDSPEPYPVRRTEALQRLREEALRTVGSQGLA